ncbi:hypothetical protein OS493_029782 [Desmophyllum pertusum]|uniref:Uncharacterized protein n=1 Tax=Desmophyllum pertusum TaxID=174260 RepID=A0A9W9YWK8_9CNID|nr:hypothetical protein OS493_029782 [Desmophyllum pertusum]
MDIIRHSGAYDNGTMTCRTVQILLSVPASVVTMFAIEHYNLAGYNNPVQTKPAPADLTVISGAYEDGVIKCKVVYSTNTLTSHRAPVRLMSAN